MISRPLTLGIAWRYALNRRGSRFVSFIAAFSVLGIALGVATLITVLAVMNGFEREVRERLLAAHAHVTVFRHGEFSNWHPLAERLAAYPQVLGVAPTLLGEGLVTTGSDRITGVQLQGLLPEHEPQVSRLAEHMLPGQGELRDLQPGSRGVIVGKALAELLAVGVGDTVNLVSARGLGGLDGLPRFRPHQVVGIIQVGLHDYDRGTVLMHLEDARALFQDDGRGGLKLRLEDPFSAPILVQQLAQEVLPAGYWVTDWTRTHGNYFAALQHQRRMLFFILVLIVAVAAFNLVATLVMVVHDKRSDIAILRTLGSSPLAVVGIFITQGMLIGAVGMLLGVIGGVLLTWNLHLLVALIETLLDAPLLAAEVYLLEELPTELRWWDVASVGGVAFALAWLATLYPAWRAATTAPAAALRYD